MHVIVNGEPQQVNDGLTVAALVSQLGLHQRRIAVEINREILARDHYGTRVVRAGDQIEIVHFVGGG